MSNYIQHFKTTFLPNYKRMVFKAKLTNAIEELIELQASIYKNWNLTKKEKEMILKDLGIWRIRYKNTQLNKNIIKH